MPTLTRPAQPYENWEIAQRLNVPIRLVRQAAKNANLASETKANRNRTETYRCLIQVLRDHIKLKPGEFERWDFAIELIEKEINKLQS